MWWRKRVPSRTNLREPRDFLKQNSKDRTAELRAVQNSDGTFTLFTRRDKCATRLRNMLCPDAVRREREAARVCLGLIVERLKGFEEAQNLFKSIDRRANQL